MEFSDLQDYATRVTRAMLEEELVIFRNSEFQYTNKGRDRTYSTVEKGWNWFSEAMTIDSPVTKIWVPKDINHPRGEWKFLHLDNPIQRDRWENSLSIEAKLACIKKSAEVHGIDIDNYDISVDVEDIYL